MDTPQRGWSHLVAEDERTLISFALCLGLKEEWLQLSNNGIPHFDIKSPAIRAKAIRYGAKVVTCKELLTYGKQIYTGMKVICVLQNAWGSYDLPIVFSPNQYNKSARTIRQKVLEPKDVMHFCNTTSVTTPTAKGKPAIDQLHFERVIKRLQSYDLILVCGNQAKEAVERNLSAIQAHGKPVLYMPHPASRTLSNAQLAEIKKLVNSQRK